MRPGGERLQSSGQGGVYQSFDAAAKPNSKKEPSLRAVEGPFEGTVGAYENRRWAASGREQGSAPPCGRLAGPYGDAIIASDRAAPAPGRLRAQPAPEAELLAISLPRS